MNKEEFLDKWAPGNYYENDIELSTEMAKDLDALLREERESMARMAYGEGLLDGRDKTSKGIEAKHVRSGKQTPLSLAVLIGKAGPNG